VKDHDDLMLNHQTRPKVSDIVRSDIDSERSLLHWSSQDIQKLTNSERKLVDDIHSGQSGYDLIENRDNLNEKRKISSCKYDLRSAIEESKRNQSENVGKYRFSNEKNNAYDFERKGITKPTATDFGRYSAERAASRLRHKIIMNANRTGAESPSLPRELKTRYNLPSCNLDTEISEKEKSMTAIRATLRLYREGREREIRIEKAVKDARAREVQDSRTSFSPKRDYQANGQVFDRLYETSKPQQIDGLKRREEISQAIKKRKETKVYSKRISAAKASEMYYRGMNHIYAKELKIAEAAHMTGRKYKSYLLSPEDLENSYFQSFQEE